MENLSFFMLQCILPVIIQVVFTIFFLKDLYESSTLLFGVFLSGVFYEMSRPFYANLLQ